MGGSRTQLITTTSALLALGAVLGFALAGWPGEPNGCRENMRPTCFCETPRSGLVAQRANTFSNLGFIVVGLGIAVVTDRQRRNRPKRRNLLTRTELYPTVFAVVTVLLGPGSMFMHASLTRWGGLVDVASMYLFAGFLVAYNVTRLRTLSPSAFLLIFISLVTLLVGAQGTVGLPVEVTFGLLLTTSVAIDWWLSRHRPQVTIDRRLMVVAIVSFLTAFAIWVPSLTGGPFCDPESWIQGHAIWHLLCALAAGAVFLYYRSEDVPLEGELP